MRTDFTGNKIMEAVNEILKLEKQIKKTKEKIQQKKDNLNSIAEANPNDMSYELMGYLKFILGFPITYFKNIDTNVQIVIPAHCKCGKEGKITIRSKEKFQNYMNGEMEYICPECDKKDIEKWEQEKKEKQEYINKLKTMPYKEYLQTEHWKEFRKKVIKRYNNRCQLCGKSGKLNVHHNNYEHRGEEDYKDVLLLCEDCHKKFHNKIKDQ